MYAGVTSKPTNLDVEGSHWDAESWLLSPELEMDGIQASWDSVSRLNIPEGDQQLEVRTTAIENSRKGLGL